jgi:predicted Fe-Mo cluster-binding NifX family protein
MLIEGGEVKNKHVYENHSTLQCSKGININ